MQTNDEFTIKFSLIEQGNIIGIGLLIDNALACFNLQDGQNPAPVDGDFHAYLVGPRKGHTLDEALNLGGLQIRDLT